VTWLRKVTLQAMVLAPARDPVIFLADVRGDVGGGWLEPTTIGLTAGTEQVHRSRRR